MVRIGIFAAQGAITEHLYILNKTFRELGIEGEVTFVKRKEEVRDIDGIIIPGGESTTISKMLRRSGVGREIKGRVDDLVILGTCAGCIVLAKEIEEIESLSLMDMGVKRNAFGRQRESFEADVEVKGFSEPYHAVFIRAPAITKVWGKCEAIAKLGNKIVAARQKSMLALSFHPELTDDTRFHRLFLSLSY
jgi:5'-phosphate synthase pdxT subunit